jgi:alpha/beta hydrolase fold
MDASEYHRRRRFARTPFGDIAFVERGSGPVAVFLHGYPLNGYQWRNIIERLSDARRCIALDLMGAGYTRTALDQAVSYWRARTGGANGRHLDRICPTRPPRQSGDPGVACLHASRTRDDGIRRRVPHNPRSRPRRPCAVDAPRQGLTGSSGDPRGGPVPIPGRVAAHQPAAAPEKRSARFRSPCNSRRSCQVRRSLARRIARSPRQRWRQ